MSNTFGSQSDQRPLYDPREITQARMRFHRDEVPELGRANSLYVSGGRWPCRGWILLRREDLDAFSLFSTNFELHIRDEQSTSPSELALGSLSIVQSRCVTTGVSADPDAIYLVEVTDLRGVLSNRWFQFPLNVQYNVRAPGYPGLYYADTLFSGGPWTWTGMIGNIWESMPLLGTYPGLPDSPASTPENWIFPGVPAWHALCDVLDHLGLTVAVDLTAASPYTIVRQGDADAAHDARTALYAGRLQDDMEWVDVGSGRVPGTVKVHFHRRNEYYGSEETVRRDNLQWQTNSVYVVSKPAPAFFTGAQGTAILWDDFRVRYDADGVPVAADVTTAGTIATERVNQFFDMIYSGTSGFMQRLYIGALPFPTGSKVDWVCHRQDFRRPHVRQGWLTEICQGAPVPYREMTR